jgi:hypothetical protein
MCETVRAWPKNGSGQEEKKLFRRKKPFCPVPRLISVSRIEAEEIGAIAVMRKKLFRVCMVLSAGGAVAAAVLSGAAAASAAPPHAPSWHPVLSVPGGGVAEAVVATGKGTGWAFLRDGSAYQRVGAAAWEKVAFPGRGGYVNAAAASSPSNVWAAFRPAAGGGGSQVDRWNGRQWSVVRSFGGSVTSLSVLGPDDVWAFGGASYGEGVFHFNGRGWAEVSPALSGGSAVSDRDVWAYSGTRLAHYDGRKWTEASVAGLFPASTGGRVAPALTGVLALAPGNVFAVGVGWAGVGGGAAVVLHFNGHGWSRAAAGPAVLGPAGPVSDGRGGLWMTSDTHQNFEVLLHYSAGRLVSAGEPFMSVASIPGTAEALGGNASPVATTPAVYQYS